MFITYLIFSERAIIEAWPRLKESLKNLSSEEGNQGWV